MDKRYVVRNVGYCRNIFDGKEGKVVLASSQSPESIRNIRASDVGLGLLCSAFNDIEELKARVPGRPEPAEAPCEDRDAGELKVLREEQACIVRELRENGFYQNEGEALSAAVARVLCAHQAVLSGMAQDRDAMWRLIRGTGQVPIDGEGLPQALERLLETVDGREKSLRDAIASVKRAVEGLG
jgi:mannose-6-phosphate isomerase-like protein (cupin superfamily)